MSTTTGNRPFAKAAKNFKRWTADDDTTLREMISKGKNSEQIARKLGRTRASVMGRKSFLGIEEKMTQARGSEMPYTSFARNKRVKGRVVIQDTVVEKPIPSNKPEIIPVQSIGTTIDSIIEKAKTMGLKIKISLESAED